ncbi:MAG TPA: hypothetical protein VHN80_26365, partial [Kineosporiaceae bacterium]|nr:hypothetical protein [Kineosporiaceae bacterium]
MGVDVEQLRAPSSRWRELVDALFLDSELIVDRVVASLVDRPRCHRTTSSELRPGVQATIAHLIREMHEGHLPEAASPRTLVAFTELGERQARQGATMSDLVHSWRVCGHELIRRAREVTSDDP